MENYNFSAAISEGLDAGIAGRDQRKSIKGMINKFAEALKDGVSSKLGVCAKFEFHEPSPPPSFHFSASRQGSSVESNSLSACAEGSNFWFEILKVEMSDDRGFPCAIVSDGDRVCCSDAEALHDALNSVARNRGTYIVEHLTKA